MKHEAVKKAAALVLALMMALSLGFASAESQEPAADNAVAAQVNRYLSVNGNLLREIPFVQGMLLPEIQAPALEGQVFAYWYDANFPGIPFDYLVPLTWSNDSW